MQVEKILQNAANRGVDWIVWIARMGNIISSLQHRIIKAEVIPTPALKNLTDSQVKIVKSTWEIPAAKVSQVWKFQAWINSRKTFFQPHDFGEKILLLYFERFPHNQQKFAAFRNTPLIVLKGKDNPAICRPHQVLSKSFQEHPDSGAMQTKSCKFIHYRCNLFFPF